MDRAAASSRIAKYWRNLRGSRGLYAAVFNVQILDKDRNAGKLTIRGWANLSAAAVAKFSRLLSADVTLDDDDAVSMATNFNWADLRNNLSSAGGIVTLVSFGRSQPHETGSWDATGTKLTRCGIIQPTIGRPIGQLIEQGGPICRPEFYRKSSCMLSLFLETWHDRIVAKRNNLTLAGLYYMATNLNLKDGEPAGVSLKECETWLKCWRLHGRAVNIRGELIWRYDHESPNKHIVGGNVWNLMIHDGHVWSIDPSQSRAFTRSMVDHKTIENIPTDSSIIVSDRWLYPPALENSDVPAVVNNLEDIIKAAAMLAAGFCITNQEPEKLAIDAWNAGYEPGSIRLKHGTVDRFSLRIEGKIISIGRAIDGDVRDDQIIASAMTARSQVVFAANLEKLRSAYNPRDGLSVYSASLGAAFRNFPRGPRCGAISELADQIVEIDVCRAYTSLLAAIPKIPVFSSFDELRPYNDGAIDELAFYSIRVHLTDPILFPQTYDLVPGGTVLYAQKHNINITIFAEAVPSRAIATNGPALLRALYADDDVSDQARKEIANIVYGLCNKSKHSMQKADCYLDHAEAASTGGYLLKLGPGYLSVKQASRILREGYLPIGRLVLDGMRRLLHSIVSALKDADILALAVRTDAVYIDSRLEAKAKAALQAAKFKIGGRDWFRVGALRLSPRDATFSKLDDSGRGMVPALTVPMPHCERLILSEEEATLDDKWTAVDELMPRFKPQDDSIEALLAELLGETMVRGPLAIEAAVPGAGKTYLVKKWIDRTNQTNTALIVCPWNALVSACVKEGYRAITLHELCGKLVADAGYKKSYNVSGVTHVHFEEAYLYTIREVEWLATFMHEHPDITYTLAGDPGQLMPIYQELRVDSDAWYEMAFASLFPRRLCLQISKRVNADDRIKMRQLCDDLAEGLLPISQICARLEHRSFLDLTEDDAKFPHIAAMRSTMARVDHWAHEAIGATFKDEYEIGEELLGVDGCTCKGGRISPNESYTVVSADDDNIKLAAPNGSFRNISIQQAARWLKRPYCRTGHSTQGLSLGDKIYIHDTSSHMATHRWMRTVVSRCRTLDIIIVTNSEGIKSNQVSVRSRIQQHISSDDSAGFVWDQADYVTVADVMSKLKRQRYSCHACAEPLDEDWSIDRLVNALPHFKDNIALSCRRCQHASSHRP